MNTHVDKRLFVAAAVLGGVALFAAAFFVALGVRSVVAGPGASPGGPVPNPGHQWTELQDHGIDGGDYWLGTIDMQALELRVNNARALRLEPDATSPNVIGGDWHNDVTDGAVGATIGGGGANLYRNQVTDDYGVVGGGRLNLAGNDADPTDDARYATVGGGQNNTADYYGTVSGGYNNTASDDYPTVGGGQSNAAQGNSATVGGGNANTASGGAATVAGGQANTASDWAATVGGGWNNEATNDDATVSGGVQNSASGLNATVGGGGGNSASFEGATVGGGQGNTATAGYDPTVGGGHYNTASAHNATVGGGYSNTAGGTESTIGGGESNTASGDSATVAGGFTNTASNGWATVGGGGANTASGDSATVAGGDNSTASGGFATVGGGWNNQASGDFATVSGGGRSDFEDPATNNRVTDDYGTIGGGGNNQAGNAAGDPDDAPYNTVSGGEGNVASASLWDSQTGRWWGHATVGGGYENTASGDWGTVGGGGGNTAGAGSTVGGGAANTASGLNATVPGGEQNTAAGELSFAAGYRAKANHQGAFVWGDSTDADVASTGNDQFIVRASGGIWFGTTSSPDLTAGFINTSTGGYLSTAGFWTDSSDRDQKENFTSVDGQEVLASLAEMPITTWNHKAEDASIRHMGPVAQDFYAAFGLGEDELHIASLDSSGVALVAIQALYELSQEQAERIQALETENDDLEARVAALEEEAEVNGGSAGSLSSIMPAGWLLFGALFLGGLVLVQRRRAGGRR